MHGWRRLIPAAFSLGLAVSSTSHAEAKQPRADSAAWLALGHYHKSFGGWRSDITGPAFFLSAHGATDPAGELAATIAAMRPGVAAAAGTAPVVCAFPARALFLKAHGIPVQAAVCPGFTAFRDELAAQHATLIFAAAYANNPASMFGHILLRLDQTPAIGRQALLANTVAFLARVDTDDEPIAYTLKGLAGGYLGAFNIDPYYTTVAYYASGDNRDLWEYDLNLSSSEVSTLVAHLWELREKSQIPYYFLHNNCAYQILALLAVVRPDDDLLHNLGTFVLPLEVARQLQARLGTGAPQRMRPSLKRQLQHQLSLLTPKERRIFGDLAGKLTAPPEASPQLLDAYISYLNFRKFAAHNQIAPPERKALRGALLARAKVSSNSDPNPPQPAPPDAGHAPAMLRFGGGARDRDSFASLRLRPGLHDLLNDDAGYESFAAISYFDLALRWYRGEAQPRLDRLTIAEVNSLSPFTLLLPELSWRLKAAWEEVSDWPTRTALQLRLEAGAGVSLDFFDHQLALYEFLIATADASPVFRGGLRAGPGSTTGLNLKVGDSGYHLLAEASVRHDVLHAQDSRTFSLGQSLILAHGYDLRVEWLLATDVPARQSHHEAVATLGAYF